MEKEELKKLFTGKSQDFIDGYYAGFSDGEKAGRDYPSNPFKHIPYYIGLNCGKPLILGKE